MPYQPSPSIQAIMKKAPGARTLQEQQELKGALAMEKAAKERGDTISNGVTDRLMAEVGGQSDAQQGMAYAKGAAPVLGYNPMGGTDPAAVMAAGGGGGANGNLAGESKTSGGYAMRKMADGSVRATVVAPGGNPGGKIDRRTFKNEADAMSALAPMTGTWTGKDGVMAPADAGHSPITQAPAAVAPGGGQPAAGGADAPLPGPIQFAGPGDLNADDGPVAAMRTSAVPKPQSATQPSMGGGMSASLIPAMASVAELESPAEVAARKKTTAPTTAVKMAQAAPYPAQAALDRVSRVIDKQMPTAPQPAAAPASAAPKAGNAGIAAAFRLHGAMQPAAPTPAPQASPASNPVAVAAPAPVPTVVGSLSLNQLPDPEALMKRGSGYDPTAWAGADTEQKAAIKRLRERMTLRMGAAKAPGGAQATDTTPFGSPVAKLPGMLP